MFKQLLVALGVAATSTMTVAPTAVAQSAAVPTFPTKPMRIVVPYPPGGFNDTLGRMVAQHYQSAWGQTAVVENRPGGGTLIGGELVAKSDRDGHTLLIVALPFSVIPSLYPKARFDVVRDFAPVMFAGSTPNLLVINPNVPVNSLAEFIVLAKKQPGVLTYASAGSGSSNHLSMEMFKTMTGTDMVHIPYKGSAPALADLLGGQVQSIFDNFPNVIQQVRAGKLRALAITSAKRSSQAPDIPTVAEAGVPGYEVTVWFGIVAPAGTPPEIVLRLNQEANKMLQLPEFRERFLRAGVEPIGGTPAEFSRHIQTEVTKWAKVVRESGAKVD